MHRANNTVIMQTEQLGRIKALEEELRSSKAKVVEMEQKMTEQDRVIAQLVGDNLDHLQDNMRLTAHINSSNARLEQMEHRLGQVGSVVMGFLEGRLESLMEEELEGTALSLSSDQGTSDASGDNRVVQASGEVNVDSGVSPRGSMRPDSPMPPTSGLIASMERDAEEAGLGGWFNGNPEDVPESWSGSNSGASASQDRVGVTLLTTIGGRTLPNPVRVPDNMVHLAVLTSLMEGPVRFRPKPGRPDHRQTHPIPRCPTTPKSSPPPTSPPNPPSSPPGTPSPPTPPDPTGAPSAPFAR